jgi:hypothetical protein
MKTKQEYIDSLRKLDLEIYLFGERVTNFVDHPIIRPSLECVAATYEAAEKTEHRRMMTAKSHISGKTINRFCHIHRSTADLVAKSKMERGLGAYTGSCFQRCVGMDALNALSIITYNIDHQHGTHYYQRFLKYLAYVQDEDLTCCGAMTDAKGDRASGLPNSRTRTSISMSSKSGKTASSSGATSSTRQEPSAPTRLSACRPPPCGKKTKIIPFPSPCPAIRRGLSTFMAGSPVIPGKPKAVPSIPVMSCIAARNVWSSLMMYSFHGKGVHVQRTRVYCGLRGKIRCVPSPELCLQVWYRRYLDRRQRVGG